MRWIMAELKNRIAIVTGASNGIGAGIARPCGAEGPRANGVLSGDTERRIVAATPFGRFGRSADIGKVRVFLESEAAGWITGERDHRRRRIPGGPSLPGQTSELRDLGCRRSYGTRQRRSPIRTSS